MPWWFYSPIMIVNGGGMREIFMLSIKNPTDHDNLRVLLNVMLSLFVQLELSKMEMKTYQVVPDSLMYQLWLPTHYEPIKIQIGNGSMLVTCWCQVYEVPTSNLLLPNKPLDWKNMLVVTS
ncbi:hypothetical protein ACJX0J_013006, partial [Zea mays]